MTGYAILAAGARPEREWLATAARHPRDIVPKTRLTAWDMPDGWARCAFRALQDLTDRSDSPIPLTLLAERAQLERGPVGFQPLWTEVRAVVMSLAKAWEATPRRVAEDETTLHLSHGLYEMWRVGSLFEQASYDPSIRGDGLLEDELKACEKDPYVSRGLGLRVDPGESDGVSDPRDERIVLACALWSGVRCLRGLTGRDFTGSRRELFRAIVETSRGDPTFRKRAVRTAVAAPASRGEQSAQGASMKPSLLARIMVARTVASQMARDGGLDRGREEKTVDAIARLMRLVSPGGQNVEEAQWRSQFLRASTMRRAMGSAGRRIQKLTSGCVKDEKLDPPSRVKAVLASCGSLAASIPRPITTRKREEQQVAPSDLTLAGPGDGIGIG